MLDQSFSCENFRKILDYENRKGRYLEGKFFLQVAKISSQIKEINQELNGIGRNNDNYKRLLEKRDKLKEDREKKLVSELAKVSERVTSSNFRITLNKIDVVGEKTMYTVGKSAESYFSMKQLQHNLARLYKIKQGDRYAIVDQVKCLLENDLPKYVVRTDIKDFYETLPHETLLEKINEENLLTFSSKRIIREVLKEYKTKSSTTMGVPRGVGVSAYIAELYMRDVDSRIKQLPNVTFYARYVDDIVAIFTPQAPIDTRDYLKDIILIIEEQFNLKCNRSDGKTKSFDLRKSNVSCNMEFLGYNFQFGRSKEDVIVSLSSKKIEKYKHRITESLKSYQNLSKINSKKARRLLLNRFKFITGNTRLLNNKNNILIGVYFSNSHLTNRLDWRLLDIYLNQEIDKFIDEDNLQRKFKSFSFEEGFVTKRFCSFTANEISEILKAWKHGKI